MINALKRRLAAYFARKPYVRHLVYEDLAEKIRKEVKQNLASDPDFIDMATAALQAHPERFADLLWKPKNYRTALVQLSKNPEALYELLKQYPFRSHLCAQGDFLRHIAMDPDLMKVLLRQVPVAHRTTALSTLLEEDANQVDALTDDSEALASAMYLGQISKVDDPEDAYARKALRTLARCVGAQSPHFINAVAEKDPRMVRNLMEYQHTREQIAEYIASDLATLSMILELATVHLQVRSSPGERLHMLLKVVADMPAFRTALLRNEDLRETLRKLLRDSCESSGQPLKPDARAIPAGTATGQ